MIQIPVDVSSGKTSKNQRYTIMIGILWGNAESRGFYKKLA